MTDVFHVDDESIVKAEAILRQGGVIVYPTDSVYGLACHALNLDAVKRVNDIKAREMGKPLQIEVSPEFAARYAYIDAPAQRITRKFWPGALSIIVPKKASVPDFVSQTNVCLSCQANKVSRRISALLGKPFVTTSANLAGEDSPKSLGEVSESVLSAVDLVLDAGPTKYGVPNTILDLSCEPVEIIREGPVKKKDLVNLVKFE